MVCSMVDPLPLTVTSMWCTSWIVSYTLSFIGQITSSQPSLPTNRDPSHLWVGVATPPQITPTRGTKTAPIRLKSLNQLFLFPDHLPPTLTNLLPNPASSSSSGATLSLFRRNKIPTLKCPITSSSEEKEGPVLLLRTPNTWAPRASGGRGLIVFLAPWRMITLLLISLTC